jgi:hypothetical protein
MQTKKCRCCGETALKIIMDYGMVALADSFLYEKEISDEQKFHLNLCICKNCFHVQIDEIINPKILFENYVWETGISKSIFEFANRLYEKTKELMIKEESKILEIASNDGTVLSIFKKNGCKILGVEPAKNIALDANKIGIPTIDEFFNYETAKRIAKDYGKWDVCIARNVIAHVSDLHGLVQGIQTILDKDGFALIEFPHLQKMYSDLQYDQVFHEHIGYHSLHSIVFLFGLYNMEVFDVEELEVHGGSLRVYVKHAESKREIKYDVVKIMISEANSGIFSINNWTSYANRCEIHKNTLRGMIEKCKNDGENIIIYGASGKGQSLIQMSGITKDLISGVVDKSKMKQGKLTPGSHIKIYPTEYIYESKANVILLCAWNIAKEIVTQEKRFVELGGKFLLPFPEPHFYNK